MADIDVIPPKISVIFLSQFIRVRADFLSVLRNVAAEIEVTPEVVRVAHISMEFKFHVVGKGGSSVLS